MKIYVQVGAGAGDKDSRANFRDGFTEYIKKLDKSLIGRILLIEPNPINIPFLRECWEDYPQAEFFNIGICLKVSLEKFINFYYAEEDGPNYQVFSMSMDHVQKHYPNQVLKESIVECITLDEFIKKNIAHNEIELLALDIEGIDAEILMETDFKKINCHQISFEYLHLGDKSKMVAETLVNGNYKFIGKGLDHNGYDYLYEKQTRAIFPSCFRKKANYFFVLLYHLKIKLGFFFN